jgi:ethanolamine utilization protein EutP (predicted NTPase)
MLRFVEVTGEDPIAANSHDAILASVMPTFEQFSNYPTIAVISKTDVAFVNILLVARGHLRRYLSLETHLGKTIFVASRHKKPRKNIFK